MSDRQKVEVIGRLGKDPVTREVGQSTVTNLSIGVGSGRGDDRVTTWYRAEVWGSHGKACEKHLRKGSLVFAEGDLQVAKNGEYLNIDIKNARVTFLPGQGQQEEQEEWPKNKGKQSQRRRQEESDEDLPF